MDGLQVSEKQEALLSSMVDSIDCLLLEADDEPLAPAEPPPKSARDLGSELLDAFGLSLRATEPAPELLLGLRDLVRPGHVAPAPEAPPETQDEASEAVEALEGLWQKSRRDTALRLMRASRETHLLRLETHKQAEGRRNGTWKGNARKKQS